MTQNAVTHDAMFDRIRTLLAIADGGSPYPEERALARERAEKLMVRHAIDEAGVRLSPAESVRPGARVFTFEGAYQRDQLQLACAVAGVFSCRSVMHGVQRITAVGFESDLALAAALIESLVPAMRTEMTMFGGSASRKKAFATAYTWAVTRRLREFYAGALREAEQEGTGSAVVLADRSERVDAAVTQMFPALRAARRRRLTSEEGWGEGTHAGLRADISLGRKIETGAVCGSVEA